MSFNESIYFKIYADIWGLHKRYFNIRDADDERWETLIRDINTICQKYQGQPEFGFVKALALEVLTELERVGREATCSNMLTN